MGIVHDMLEDFVNLQGGAAFLGVQDRGINSEGPGDLDAVDTGNRAGLLNGQNLGTQFARGNRGHEARTAAADDADVHIVGLVRAGLCRNGFCKPGFLVAAGLRHAVSNSFLDGTGP